MKRILSLLLTLIFVFSICSCANYNYKYISHGDSITWYDGNDFPNGEKCIGYQQSIVNMLGVDEYKNLGQSGMPTANGVPDRPGVVNTILKADHSKAELCTILCGTNDFKLNVELGCLSDSDYDDETFYGAYQISIEKILKDNPNITLVLITPIQRDKDGYDIYSTNEVGYKLEDYVNAVIELGKYYNLPVCDLYNNCVIKYENITDYTIDGLHPNNEGQKIMGDYICEFLKDYI